MTLLIFVILMAGISGLTAFATEGDGQAAEYEVDNWADLRRLVSTASEETVKIKVTGDLTWSGDWVHNTGNTVEINLGGHTVNGGGHLAFYNESGTMTIKNGTITNCRTEYGGAINNRGELTLEEVHITDCSSDKGGGGIINYGILKMNGGSITNCQSARGAAIRIVPHSAGQYDAMAYLTDVEISGNKSDGRNDVYGRGGAISVSNGSLDMTGCKVIDNETSDDDGGAIDFDSEGWTLRLTETEITGNKASRADHQGGGINLERGDALIQNCKITENYAEDGGGIYIASSFGTCTITGSEISSNSTPEGGKGGGTECCAAL